MENLLQTQISLQANYLAAEQGQEVREQAASDDHWKKQKDFTKRLQQRLKKYKNE